MGLNSLDFTGLILDWIGLDWTGLDWTGLDWIEEIRENRIKSIKAGNVSKTLSSLYMYVHNYSCALSHNVKWNFHSLKT